MLSTLLSILSLKPSCGSANSLQRENKMSYRNRGIMTAGIASPVDTLHDQGTLFHSVVADLGQNARGNSASALKLQGLPSFPISPSPSPFPKRKIDEERSDQAEASLRMVMYLSCWGPN
ncbi:unnamed protein product [Victoria cruziana]